ncbi:VCBS domain-containing protein [Filomicrobium sp.]|uniref:VCBS domain-containing protein n=1 Tax=Filomicrobium sp. TaxID=2024831 RepID=UPI002586F634|nr:VCBS domain-containing protein [Filomicrobium sp.]MCV0368614.1 VCBS domain-containing protein [Filomicrobium sp.]
MAAFAHGSMALAPSNVNCNESSSDAPAPTERTCVEAPITPSPSKTVSKDFFHLIGDADFEPPANVILSSYADNDDANAAHLLNAGETKEFPLSGSTTAAGSLMAGSDFTATTCVSEVSFEGMSFAVPETRPVQIPGNFGTLTIRADGTFIYSRTIHDEDFADAFTCTTKDGTERLRVTLRITTEQESKTNHARTA